MVRHATRSCASRKRDAYTDHPATHSFMSKMGCKFMVPTTLYLGLPENRIAIGALISALLENHRSKFSSSSYQSFDIRLYHRLLWMGTIVADGK